MNTVMKIYHSGETWIIWRKLIYVMKVDHCDENCTVMKFVYFDKYFL